MTRWLDPIPVDVPASFADLNLPPFIAQTLVRRGLTDIESARAFLHPESLPSVPFPGIEKAVDYIVLATRKNEPICVWGDFDVDGQTSTTLLVQTLRAFGANVIFYIPIRSKESHGVHIESLKPVIDHGTKLIVTCDTGITAHEAIDYANSRGVDVVVTDHHDLGETLPNAKAIVNPKLLPEGHLLANLAGVGVAYKLAEALFEIQESEFGNRELPPDSQITTPDSLLDLVALGLIADVALLKGETRSLAQKGIQALRKTKRVGLKVIAELSGTNLETLTEETIGFTFAPRLNALGRLGDANPAVELLLTQDAARARVTAAQIEGLNAQRRLLTSQVYEAAEAQLREKPDLLTEPAIVLSHSNWPGGVVGIAANRLVDRYHKPAILLNEAEDGIMRGSARSVEGLHITEAITANKELLLGFGGHPMAAGLSLPADKLTQFRKGLGKAIEKQLGITVREEPALQIDAWLGLNELNFELANALESLAPFGAGNPLLTLATRKVIFKAALTIGKTKEHLRLNVEDENGAVQSILWWNGAGEELPETDSRIDIAYSLRAGTYRGEKQLTLQFVDFRVIQEPAVEVGRYKADIIDWRLQTKQIDSLTCLKYAEGEDKKKIHGTDRYHLTESNELAIWTSPPSPSELRVIMEQVKPRRVYLFAIAPPEEKADDFLKRLAGLAKYAINQRGGKVAIEELAVATAQRVSAVRSGLEWLAAGGHISIVGEEDAILLSPGSGEANQYLQREFFVAVKGLLEESAAFRVHFARSKADLLFK